APCCQEGRVTVSVSGADEVSAGADAAGGGAFVSGTLAGCSCAARFEQGTARTARVAAESKNARTWARSIGAPSTRVGNMARAAGGRTRSHAIVGNGAKVTPEQFACRTKSSPVRTKTRATGSMVKLGRQNCPTAISTSVQTNYTGPPAVRLR